MKQVNQLIHLTPDLERIKSILKNGFYTSYAKETFGNKSILIPMISFTNILYRDIGTDEVVDYGNYGVVFDREYAIKKFDLNPVTYIRDEGIIENSIKDNFETSILPQTLNIIKDIYMNSQFEKITDHINFNPISDKIKNLLNSIDKNVNDEVIKSLQVIFGDYFMNSLYQLLLAKPYIVLNKKDESKIAYNEREWRKSFWNLNFISQYRPNGDINPEYQKWLYKPKPHYVSDYILCISLSDIKAIIVKEEFEIYELKQFLKQQNIDCSTVLINTLTNFKNSEKNIN